VKIFRIFGFGLLSIVLTIAVYASLQLPIIYKAIAVPIAVLFYVYLTVRIFELAEPPHWLNVTVIVLLVATIYFLFPTIYNVNFVDTNGQQIEGIVLANGDVYSGQKIVFLQPRGYYKIRYTGVSREVIAQNKNTIFNPLPVVKTITLAPGTYNYAKTKFYDPYKQEEVVPEIEVKGKDIDGKAIELKADINTRIPYGSHEIRFDTKYFSKTEKTDPVYAVQSEILLQPNENTVVLNDEEIKWVQNYMRDYLDLSARRIIPEGGFPKQYHLYTKNQTLSQGDMLFLICQLNQEEQPVHYILKDSEFVKGGDEKECYLTILNGRVPAKMHGVRTEQIVYDYLVDVPRTIRFDFGALNQKKHVLDWALSYDIEYGRYVPRSGVSDATYSTCDVAPGFLTQQQCSDADFAGWASRSTGTWWYNEYGYPVSSGLIGWRYILELSDDYGIPTTDYIVTKDLKLFEEKDPAIIALSKKLAKEGLMEVGSQTRYHTRLDMVTEAEAKIELRESRKYLEEFYNVSVVGIRTPYLSLVNGDISDTEGALEETGYKYYSLYGMHRTDGVEHKPVNFYGYMSYAEQGHVNKALRELKYVISLDHPWNIQFKEIETEKGTLLEEAPEQPVQKLALVLDAMSKGAWFTTVDRIKIK
jgi:peptidoglycan/xylan/chitin deacetylase (PgdA/CDA1 family)